MLGLQCGNLGTYWARLTAYGRLEPRTTAQRNSGKEPW
jgi:hypothetical protein